VKAFLVESNNSVGGFEAGEADIEKAGKDGGGAVAAEWNLPGAESAQECVLKCEKMFLAVLEFLNSEFGGRDERQNEGERLGTGSEFVFLRASGDLGHEAPDARAGKAADANGPVNLVRGKNVEICADFRGAEGHLAQGLAGITEPEEVVAVSEPTGAAGILDDSGFVVGVHQAEQVGASGNKTGIKAWSAGFQNGEICESGAADESEAFRRVAEAGVLDCREDEVRGCRGAGSEPPQGEVGGFGGT